MDHELAINSIEEAVERIHHIKVEHREILEKIARDPGMNPDTRWELISHLYDEEDEHVGVLQAFVQNPAPQNTNPGMPQVKQAGLTVGSLRNQTSSNSPASMLGTVGSLRRRRN